MIADIAQDKINLISEIIRNDRKFLNNEDLYDDFLNETCKRSMTIVNMIDNEATLSSYIRRIATTAIINVLKDNGRLRRTKSGYMSTNEIIAEPLEIEKETIDYSTVRVSYDDLSIPKSPEDIVIQKDILQFIARTVKNIDREDKDKNYLKIYSLRYDEGMTQKQIAQELDLSQSEVSKRLFKLMSEVKKVFEQ